MSRAAAPTETGPTAYETWRATSLGAITEAIEQRVILDLIGNVEGAHVLDAGCGDGTLVCELASRSAKATGIDPDPTMLAAARVRAEEARVVATFRDGRVERLPFPDASFDVVAAITVLCFVADAAGAAREMARVLRPGGCLVIGELGRWSVWAAWRRVRGWFRSGIWAAARFRTASELRVLAAQAGLGAITVRGAVFYPPIALFARAMAPFDPQLGRLKTFGAAFIALRAIKGKRP